MPNHIHGIVLCWCWGPTDGGSDPVQVRDLTPRRSAGRSQVDRTFCVRYGDIWLSLGLVPSRGQARAICLLNGQVGVTEGRDTQSGFPQSGNMSLIRHGIYIFSPLTLAGEMQKLKALRAGTLQISSMLANAHLFSIIIPGFQGRGGVGSIVHQATQTPKCTC